MCGIVGMFDVDGRHRADRATLERMTAAVAHRGPDACSDFVEDDIAFGFRRLSIVDPEGGHQPMWSEGRSVVSVCNGEIFNWKELSKWARPTALV